MNAKEQVEQDLYDIIAEILNKVRRQARENNLRLTEKQQDINNTTQNAKESQASFANKTRTTKKNSHIELLTIKKNSLNELLTAKQNLNSIKEKLQKNPRQYKRQLNRLEKVEQKLDNSIRRAEQKAIILALNTLHNDPRRYVLKLVDSKIKIDTLKKKLNENPRKYKAEIEKLIQFEKKLNQNIEKAKSKMLNKAIFYVVKNPEKFKKEINRYNQMEIKLKENLVKNEKENKQNIDKSKESLKYKKIEKNRHHKEKTNKKELELSR